MATTGAETQLAPLEAQRTAPLTAPHAAIEIDRDIRNSIVNRRLSIITMSLNLANLKAKSLFRDLGCQSMPEYIRRLCRELKMDRSSFYKWLYIGEAYINYREALEQIGFGDRDGPTKLIHLENALEKNEKNEVFSKIKNMSLRDFIAFSRSVSPPDTPAEKRLAGNDIDASRRFTIKINTRLDRKSFAYLRKIISMADRALEEGELIIPVRLRNMEEARRFKKASARIISRIRERA